MRLKIQEIVRTLDGDIVVNGKNYEVESTSLELRKEFCIKNVGDYYCLQMSSEILILKKKFEKYMLIDNMSEMLNDYKVKLGSKGIVVSIGSKLLELNCISFGYPKCKSRICDIIEFPQELADLSPHFLEVWPIIIKK